MEWTNVQQEKRIIFLGSQVVENFLFSIMYWSISKGKQGAILRGSDNGAKLYPGLTQCLLTLAQACNPSLAKSPSERTNDNFLPRLDNSIVPKLGYSIAPRLNISIASNAVIRIVPRLGINTVPRLSTKIVPTLSINIVPRLE